MVAAAAENEPRWEAGSTSAEQAAAAVLHQEAPGRVHCDADAVGLECVASAVIFLRGPTGGEAGAGGAVAGAKGAGLSGELCFADGDGDRLVAAVAGRLVGWTSGIENCHRVAATLCGDGPRTTLALWFAAPLSNTAGVGARL